MQKYRDYDILMKEHEALMKQFHDWKASQGIPADDLAAHVADDLDDEDIDDRIGQGCPNCGQFTYDICDVCNGCNACCECE